MPTFEVYDTAANAVLTCTAETPGEAVDIVLAAVDGPVTLTGIRERSENGELGPMIAIAHAAPTGTGDA